MAKEKIIKVKYFTKDKEKYINPDNWKKYQKYLQSNIIKNQDVKNTTYKRYEGLFRHFLMWLGENYGDIDLYSDEFMENAVDIMEGYMLFCQEVLHNHKKIINMKVSAVSSFYIWSMKRGFVKYHPFDGKLDRMKKASEEQILNHYFLTDEQIAEIRKDLYSIENNKQRKKHMSIMKKYTRKLKKKINKKKMKMEEIDVMELKKIRNRARLITDTRIKKKTHIKYGI